MIFLILLNTGSDLVQRVLRRLVTRNYINTHSIDQLDWYSRNIVCFIYLFSSARLPTGLRPFLGCQWHRMATTPYCRHWIYFGNNKIHTQSYQIKPPKCKKHFGVTSLFSEQHGFAFFQILMDHPLQRIPFFILKKIST